MNLKHLTPEQVKRQLTEATWETENLTKEFGIFYEKIKQLGYALDNVIKQGNVANGNKKLAMDNLKYAHKIMYELIQNKLLEKAKNMADAELDSGYDASKTFTV